MDTCIIFCAAGFDRLEEPVLATDHIIAADGGLRHTQALGLNPYDIIGDFDSLGYVPQDSRVFPVEKDDTDSMLSVKRGLELGYRRFMIYGGMDGKRLDHTIANFQTLQYLADHGAAGYLVGKDYLATVVKNGSVSFPEGTAGDFSLFCMGADAAGVTIQGLYYTVDDVTLTAGFPLGVSNHFTGKPACITVQDGSLLLLWERQAGMPTPAASCRGDH